ncbi:DUF1697 domain-containing protein [Thalassotalea sediminis]|uniref:DUF1697 domain-containing protein n=1 Tax=Thalassotalea sediminis TaxID=1759089 RepID=UPI0025732CC6|nr:DUF1697 domain-containing protein [Thalassotalea sediminis]
MEKFVVLFRGINVGGNNLLPMKALVPLLEDNHYQNISTYIQSGNVVLESQEDPTVNIQNIVTNHFGFTPKVISFKEDEWLNAFDNNPYTAFEGKFVHLYFCNNTIVLDSEKLTKYISHSEQYHINDNVFYLHAPDGIGRSKLIANIERCLQQDATGRNLNTVKKLSSMLNQQE